MNRVLTILCFLMVALWIGMGFYFTAFAANELFASLPQDIAGQAVGALFPTFFALSTGFSAAALVLFVWIGQRTAARGALYKTALASAVVGFLLNAFNQFYMLPRIQDIEKAMGPLSQAAPDMMHKFGMWHGMSMLVELISLIAAALLFVMMTSCVNWRWGGKGDPYQ